MTPTINKKLEYIWAITDGSKSSTGKIKYPLMWIKSFDNKLMSDDYFGKYISFYSRRREEFAKFVKEYDGRKIIHLNSGEFLSIATKLLNKEISKEYVERVYILPKVLLDNIEYYMSL